MDQRRVQLYASIAEIVSAVAVVISLLYVASEFRQAKTLTERDVDHELFERVREENRILIENPDVAAMVIAAATDPGQLTPVDRLRYLALQHQFFDSWELAWGYHADGVLGDELWSEWDGWFGDRARRLPPIAWAGNRENFSGLSFRTHVDRVVGFDGATPSAAPPAGD
jgi:hypothetical protein